MLNRVIIRPSKGKSVNRIMRTVYTLVFTLVSGPVHAGEVSPSPDEAEAGSNEAIAAFTTEARFVSPWVAYVPRSATVPSPTSFLGHVVGAAGELTHSAKIVEYVRKLAENSPRVHVENIGVSEEGRHI
jgi:hypothetical protein